MATAHVAPTARQLWFRSLRAPFLVASLIPMAMAALLAWGKTGALDVPLLGMTALGLGAIHIGANMLNDNFDFRSGADQAVMHSNPFAGGSRVLLEGVLGLRAHLGVALAFVGLGIAVGLYLVLLKGPLLLVIGLLGVVLGVFYVAPPLRIAHHGVGEVAVAVAFGPTIVLGTYYVQTQTLDNSAAVLSLPLGLLVMAILWVNEFPDVGPDAIAGKRTLVLRIGLGRSAAVYAALLMGAYLVVVLGAAAGVLPLSTLAVLLSLPVALKAVAHLRRTYMDPHAMIPANASTILLLLIFGALGIAGLAVDVLIGAAA